MATFKIMPAINNFAAVKYNENKQKNEKAERILLKNFGWLEGKNNLTETDIKSYLEKWSSFNPRVKKKQFHAVISAKGRSESFDELEKKALAIMDKLGYGNNPILFYSHSDTQNNHIHIVTSRVDEHGKKIDDSYEKMRAMKALQEVESLDLSQEFKAHSDISLAYNFENIHQFNLLMEQKGYKPKMSGAIVDYWKYNELQGGIEIAKLNEKIASIDNVKYNHRAKQLKAIIIKYQQQFDVELKNNKAEYSDGKNTFSSKLTEYLSQKHGLEFVFFSKDSADSPYGYMIIDHANKNVFKGSSVMKLSELVSVKSKQYEENISFPFSKKFHPDDRGTVFSENRDIEKSIKEFVTESMAENDTGKNFTKSKDDLPTRKRKKKYNQR